MRVRRVVFAKPSWFANLWQLAACDSEYFADLDVIPLTARA